MVGDQIIIQNVWDYLKTYGRKKLQKPAVKCLLVLLGTSAPQNGEQLRSSREGVQMENVLSGIKCPCPVSCVWHFGSHNAGIQHVVCCAWPGQLLSVPVRPFFEYLLPWEKPRNQWVQLKAFRKQPGRGVKTWRLSADVMLKTFQVAQGGGAEAQEMGSYFLLCNPKKIYPCLGVGWLQGGLVQGRWNELTQ